MDDIVQDLRAHVEKWYHDVLTHELCHSAASEIVRLRREVATLEAQIDGLHLSIKLLVQQLKESQKGI